MSNMDSAVQLERLTVCYPRVSTDEQALEGYSLHDQIDRARSYAKAKDWPDLANIDRYRDDGVSGTTRERDGLQRLLADARSGKIERVIFTKLDRLGRKAKLILDLDDELESHGVQRVYIKEGIDTTTIIGRFLRTILAAVAELERDKIVESTTEGRRKKADLGEVWTGRYGYQRLEKEPWLALDPEEAPVVKRIFGDVTAGIAANKLAVQLTAEGVPAPKGGPTWHHTAVGKIIKSPCYYGQHEYGVTLNRTVDGKRIVSLNAPEKVIRTQVPPIVTKELWEAANERFSTNRLTAKRNNKHDDLLRGLVTCASLTEDGEVCNRSMSPERDGSYRQYRCTHTISTGAQKHHNVNAEALEKAVWEAVTERLMNPSLVTDNLEALSKNRQAQVEQAEREIARIEKEAEQALVQQDNLIDTLAKGTTLPQALIEKKFAELTEKRRIMLTRVGELAAQRDDARAAVLPLESVRDACATVAAGIENLDFEGRRRIAQVIIVRILAKKDEVTIEGILPMRPVSISSLDDMAEGDPRTKPIADTRL